MKSIRFDNIEKIQDIKPRDLMSFMQSISSEHRFEKCDIHVTDYTVQPSDSPLMETATFKFYAHKKLAGRYQYSNDEYHFINYRAKDFCCMNIRFKLIPNENETNNQVFKAFVRDCK